MHLYSAAVTSISWDDVNRFCQQGAAENTYLDYKKDFPNDLARTIAAMANTLGGLILIGVDETDSGTPKLPLDGIAPARGLEERVLSIILDSMTPPVIPEIATCANSAGDKAIVVIRIPQSENAPHVLHSNNAVYIRTGKRNKPEDLASLERIDWMRSRRKKSEDLREWLFARACIRFRDMRDGRVGGVPATDEGSWKPTEEQPGLLTIALCPLYPDCVLAKSSDLAVIRRKIRIRDYMGTGEEFPLQESGCVSRMVEDGFVMHFSGVSGLRTYHTHLNMHGLFLFRQSLLWGPNDRTNVPIIRGYEILCRLYELIESGAKFYHELGYWGPLKFRLRLEGLLGIPVSMPYMEFGRLQGIESFSTDDQIDTNHVVQASQLGDDPHDVILPLFERVGWAFNTEVTPEWLRSMHAYMKKN